MKQTTLTAGAMQVRHDWEPRHHVVEPYVAERVAGVSPPDADIHRRHRRGTATRGPAEHPKDPSFRDASLSPGRIVWSHTPILKTGSILRPGIRGGFGEVSVFSSFCKKKFAKEFY